MRGFQPVSDVAIWRTAARWLERHGDQAMAKARAGVAEMQSKNDIVGVDAWLRIIAAIEAVLNGSRDQPKEKPRR